MAERDDPKRDEVVEDFLQGGPRSEEWRNWREALERRLADLKRERNGLEKGEERSELDAMIDETETQINALATEEIISEFVEAEIDLSLNTAEDEDEYGGFRENGHG